MDEADPAAAPTRLPLVEIEEPSGDAVCWLDFVCDECGAMTDAGAGQCWRCSARIERSV